MEDNGPGIADEMKPYIFEMFYTGKSTDCRQSDEVLVLVCHFAVLLLKHMMEAPGLTDNIPRGCIFTFTLPFSEVTLNE